MVGCWLMLIIYCFRVCVKQQSEDAQMSGAKQFVLRVSLFEQAFHGGNVHPKSLCVTACRLVRFDCNHHCQPKRGSGALTSPLLSRVHFVAANVVVFIIMDYTMLDSS
jgi:hypothetical protein